MNTRICKSNVYTCNDKKSNIFCGACARKIVKNNEFVTCMNCSLDFHVNCININMSEVEKCMNWFCDCCFSKVCNDELPFTDCFVDLNCKLQKGLKIAHLNIQCLTNKIDYVNLLLHNNNIDVLCLSETWLTNSIDDSELSINGYDICRLDRQNDKSHGGVICYVKEGVSFREITNFHDNDIEGLWIEILALCIVHQVLMLVI